MSYATSEWSTGFTATVTIKNTGSAGLSNWSLKWVFAGNQVISNAWDATVSQSGQTVTAGNAAYNGSVPAGGSVAFGFQAGFSGTNATPAQFSLNGTACSVGT